MPDKVSPSQFAASVKSKYPEYKDVDDIKLTNSIISKYPEYKDVVDFGIQEQAPATKIFTPGEQPAVSKYQKAVNDDRSEIGKFASVLYNGMVSSFERLGGAIADIPAQFPITAPSFSPIDIGKNEQSAKAFRDLPLSKRLEPAKQVKKGIAKAADIVRSDYTKRAETYGKFDIMDGIGLEDIKSLASMSGGMAVDMGLGALSGGGTFVLQGYNDAVEDFDSAAEKAGLEPDTAARGLYGIAGGVINGLLEKFAVDKLVGDTPVFRDIQRKAIANVLKNTAGMTGKKAVDAIETASVAEIKKLTSNLKLMGFRAAVEGGTEAAQAALEDGAKFAANLVQGNEAFNEDEIKKGFLQNVVNSGIAGGIMGPIFGAGADKAFGRNVNTQVLKDIAEAKTPEDLAAINDELAATFDENNFSQEERDAILNNAKRYSQIKQTLPEGTNPIAQTIAIPLIENRIKIDKEIENRRASLEGLDEALRADEETSISILEDKRAQINDDIREVVNNEKFNYTEKDGKFYKQLGENAPEEISKNRFDLQQIKTQGYATTTSEGKVQEGGTAGDISQREGAQKEGAQGKVDEADTGYRYIVSEEGSEFPISALVNKKVTKDGRPAILYQEGQRIVARILGTNRIEDVGNVNEMMNALPQDFGIEVQETVVTETPTGYRVEGEDMVNDNANPVDAISLDQNGNVMNVVLKTPAGKRRKFRGQAAKDLAYQITLKETLKNEDEFELFLEQEHQAELDAAEAKAVAEAETARANEPVPPVEEPVAGPTITTEPAFGKFAADNINDVENIGGLNNIQKKVLGDAKKVFNAIKGVVSKMGAPLTVNIHNQDSFEKAVIEAGGQQEDATSRGFYMASDGSIHLNMDNIASDTMLHEGFHPILDYLEANDPKVINDLFAQLESIPEAASIIAQAKDSYTGDVTQKKEAITDFVAGVADGRIILNPSNFQKIKKFISDMLNKIGIGQTSPELMKVNNEQDLINLAKFVTEKFVAGKEITEEGINQFIADRNKIAIGEQGLIAAAGKITPERISDSKIGNTNPLQFSKPEKFKEVETVSLPSKSMIDVYNEFGGNAVAINSDPTKVGNLVLPSGKEIFMYGGLNYTALKPNVDGEIGFASTRISKPEQVSRIMNTMFKDMNGEGVVLVAAQKPDSMLGNAYALEYTLDAITQLPKKILKSSEFKNEFFGKDIVAIKEAFGEKEYADFVKKYKGSDLSNPDVMEDMISTLLTDIGNNFIARNSMVSNMLAGVVEKSSRAATKGEPGYVSVTPNKFIAKALYDRLGLNQEKLFYEIGEKGIVDEYMKNGNWGFVTTGFTSDGKINPRDIQDKGVVHPQFNAKFHGKDPFILDGAYLIDKLFPPEEIITKTGKPYTKKASLMVAGSMYPKGKIEKIEKPDTRGVPAFQRVPSEDVIKGFYSPIQKRINEFKLQNASSQKWKEIVGVKSDEAVFSGLADWLNSKKPNEQISKDDINKFIKDNRIQIKEIARGGDYLVYNPKTGKDVMYFENADDAYSFVADAKEDGDTYEIDEPSQFLTTKYEEYQLPGGENYKEILITLPSNMSKLRDEMNQKYPNWGTNSFEDVFSKDDAIRYQKALDKGEFMSGHFDEANIITHLRMNTRTDADGKKVLFLEEVQSDWGQKGKREGFKQRPKELPSDFKIEQRMLNSGVRAPESGFMIIGSDGLMKGAGKTRDEAINNALDRLTTQGVSPAPFVSNTNAWVKLGLKVALKEAVKQGADRIAWTTGEQQSDRFDLSKTIESIKAIKKARPIFSAKQGPVGPIEYTLKIKYKNGEEIQTDPMADSELADAVGKDLASKIIADNGGVYSGLDLQVGSKGMKAFYGDANNTGIVGNVAKALVKELTGKEGKMEISKIEAGEQPAIDITPELKTSVKEGIPQFQKKAQIGVEKQSGTTQVATTVGSYKKAAQIANKLGAKTVLDYGAGLGLGTDAISDIIPSVDSFEPNAERWQGSSPVTYTNTSDINKKYDSVINLNVLNVVPKDIRDAIVMDIFDKLNVGGNAIISTRKWSGDVNLAKNYVKGPEEKSVIVKKKSEGKGVDVYQKGFDGNELVDYISDILGDAATVTKDNTFGASGVIINKKSDISEPQFQKAPTKPITKEKLGGVKKTFKEQVRYGLLGKESVRLKEKMGGELSAELSTAETRVKSTMAIIKKYGGAVTEKDVSDFMEGVSTGNQLPDDLATALTEMRAQIDGLTERLIQLGVIDNPESIAYYRENKGKYLLRSYESINFKENPLIANFQGKGLNIDNVAKKLKNVDNTVVNAALKYLSDRAKLANPSLTDEQAMKIARADANEILSDSEGYVMNKGMTGSTNVKSLTQRKDISPEIRALMGEYSDPLYNYYATIFKISSITASRQYLNSLKELGMGNFFFNEKTEDATVKFAGDESDALAPLNGIWTFPEIKESLQISEKETANIVSQMAGRIRMFKTVYNPATHVKNILGNMGFAISNGHWNNIPESYKYVRAAITGKTDEDIMKMMDTLNRYGVLNNVVGIGELKAYFDKNESVDDFLKTIYGDAEKSTTASRLGKAKANLSKIPKAIEKAYAIEDDVFKILAFVNESNRYAQALFSKKYDKLSPAQKEEIDNIATEIVKDTYPTFSRVPKGVKTLSKYMFLGNFLAFPVESVRTQYNSLRLARNEIVSGNKKLKAVGYTRLSGAIAYNSLFAALTMYAYNLAGAGITGAVGMLFGDDEKENDTSNAIKKNLAPWNKNSDVYVSKFKDGILEYYDIGSLDSYGYQRRVWNAFWSTKNKGEFDKMMSASIGELLDPWMTRDFVVDSYMKLSNNDNGRGGTIYNPEGKPMDKFKDMSLFAGKQFGPGFVGTSIKVADAYQKGEYEKVMDELGAQVFARRYTVDLNKQFQNYIYQEGTDPKKEVGFKYRLANAKKIYTDAKRQKLSPIELADKYREAVDAYKEILLTANEYYKSAALGGTNPKSLKASLDKSRIGRDEVKAIRTGAFSKFDRVYIPK
jgi:hypothetical protein